MKRVTVVQPQYFPYAQQSYQRSIVPSTQGSMSPPTPQQLWDYALQTSQLQQAEFAVPLPDPVARLNGFLRASRR